MPWKDEMPARPVVAVAGATGAVGREFLRVLHDLDFPASEVRALASARSAGKELPFDGCGDAPAGSLVVREMTPEEFEGVDIALFSCGSDMSKQMREAVVAAGAVMIDNSSAFRMDDDVPLVVPEVNPEDVALHRGVIANPNCSTIQMVVALKPLHDAAGIRRVVVSTYQAVSGTGQKGINELEHQVRQLFNMQEPDVEVYPHRIAFNCLPHIDVFLENEYTKEEMKMVNETVKIMEDPKIRVTATCVRVPVFYSHSESVNIETEKKLSGRDARAILATAPGVRVLDNPSQNIYPLAVDAAGDDPVFVGRIREDDSIANGLNLWIVADNIRKGAALNAVQIAEELLERDLVSVRRPDMFL